MNTTYLNNFGVHETGTAPYDGWNHATYYISNGTKVEVSIPRS